MSRKRKKTAGRERQFENMSAEEVKTIRQQLGLSQEKFAQELGFTGKTVYCWEAGRSTPSKLHADLIRKFAEGRGIAIA
jgi:DNA-binding transcriptional regulator YiaG